MLGDLESAKDIARATERLLARAEARGRLPTPVDDIVAAAELAEPEESALSDSAISSAPEHIRVAMTLVKSKVLALLDRKAREVHINPEIAEYPGQQKFKRLHEVSHDIFPWQTKLAYADDDLTLRWSTEILFEREANQGAAELLFQRELFRQMAEDYEIGCGAVLELAEKFGSSIRSAFRRYVETHRGVLAGLVLEPSPCSAEPISYRRREAFHSMSYTRRFGEPRCWPAVLRENPYSFVAVASGYVSNMFPPECDLSLPDLDNSPTELKVEIFTNSYNLFVLLWQPRRERFKHRRVVVPLSPE